MVRPRVPARVPHACAPLGIASPTCAARHTHGQPADTAHTGLGPASRPAGVVTGMSRPTSSHPRSRPGSSLKGGAATPVTLTARLTLEGEHVLTLEEWIGQELQRTHGRVKDERILFSGAAAAAPVPVPVPVPLTVPRAAPSTGASMRLAPGSTHASGPQGSTGPEWH